VYLVSFRAFKYEGIREFHSVYFFLAMPMVVYVIIILAIDYEQMNVNTKGVVLVSLIFMMIKFLYGIVKVCNGSGNHNSGHNGYGQNDGIKDQNGFHKDVEPRYFENYRLLRDGSPSITYHL
jgi:hypothetical protein